MKPPRPFTSFSLWLDFFRWVAAFAVLTTHVGNRLSLNIQDIPEIERLPLHYIFQFTIGFARQAVMIFFVISGYLIGGSLWKEYSRTGNIQIPRFATKRLVGLLIVLIPVFFIGGVFDVLGAFVFNGIHNNIYESDIANQLSLSRISCNALFLQNFFCWHFGTNGALWSLANQFWYYVIFGVFVFLLTAKAYAPVRILTALLALSFFGLLSVVQFTGHELLPYFIIWVFGVLAAVKKHPVIRSVRIAAFLFIIALLGIRLFVRAEMFQGIIGYALDITVCILFANLLLAMNHADFLFDPPGKTWNQLFANFSYSLYAIHTPILMLYAALLMDTIGLGWKMNPKGLLEWLIIVGGFSISISGAFALSRITEARSYELRNWVLAGIRI